MASKRGAPQLTDEQVRARCTCEPARPDIYAAHLSRCPVHAWQRNWGLTPTARQIGAQQLASFLAAARRAWAGGVASC